VTREALYESKNKMDSLIPGYVADTAAMKSPIQPTGRSTMNRFGRSILACACLGALALVPHTPAFAARSVTGTLVPTPPDDYTCQSVGNGSAAICRSHVSAYQPPDPWFGSCGTPGTDGYFQILESHSWTQDKTRIYNNAGLMTERIIHESDSGLLTNSVTGVSIPWSAHGTVRNVFVTPGDDSAYQETDNGQVFKATVPGMGVVVHDVGKVVIDAEGNLVFEGGPHQQLDFLQGDATALNKLCAALSAPA
jgi:hypothetical protein